MAFRSIIIDDETIARAHLRRLLSRHKDVVTVVDEAVNGIDALEKIQELRPDLIFLDVQMPGLTGFEVVKKLQQQPLIIFTTAHDEYALAAFKENAISYLLKPIAPEDLRLALCKVQTVTGAHATTDETIRRLLTQVQPPAVIERLKVKTGDSTRLLRLDEVAYFAAEEKYTTVYSTQGTHVIDTPLAELEAKLPAKHFVRIHRKYIVNYNYIAEIKKWFDRKHKVKLKPPFNAELIVSRGYACNIRAV
jgi:two-component system, LytTR family, response regulator